MAPEDLDTENPSSIFEGALVKAHRTLLALEDERSAVKTRLNNLDKEIAKLRFKMISVSALIENKIEPDSEVGEVLERIKGMGLTNAVREALKADGEPMTPTQVRDKLVRAGYELSVYKNPQALIHTILKRLAKMGDVMPFYTEEGGEQTGEYLWWPHETLKPDPAADVLRRTKQPASKAKASSKRKASKK